MLNKHIQPLKQRELIKLKKSVNFDIEIRAEKRKINDEIKKTEGLKYFDYYEIVCSQNRCPKMRNRKIIMYDNFHFTEDGAELYAEVFVKKGFFEKLIQN